jgi:subtilase family serine protease
VPATFVLAVSVAAFCPATSAAPVRQGLTAAQGSRPEAAFATCAASARPGFARCDVLIRGSAPGRLTPADLQSAYELPSLTAGAGQTVAVVEAYDDPNAASDLAVYRQWFGLPACLASTGCFVKANQRGQSSNYPQPNASWAAAISVDVDMVSAGCPLCNILLVEADDNSARSLGESVAQAVSLGAAVVGNSYGGTFPRDAEKWYRERGAVLVAAAADAGGKPGEPAAYPSVVAVGGTSLVRDGSKRGWRERVWSGAVGGCTPFPKPPWQHDAFCTTRTTNDVAAFADPNPGVAAYDTYDSPGFISAGGTSVSTPLIASVYGLAANGAILFGAGSLYQHHHDLFDISPAGYDEPTGWGTPDGVGAF